MEHCLILKEINENEIPSNFTSFYNNYINENKTELTNIKINNKILHQSKIINNFINKESTKKTAKDLNDLTKKD